MKKTIATMNPFPADRICIRPRKRDLPFDSLLLSSWLANTLDVYDLRRVGDLHGRSVRALSRLRRVGQAQLCELHAVLLRIGALEAPDLRAPATRLDTLARLLPRPLRTALLAQAPAFTALRFEQLAIRQGARAIAFDDLPMTGPLRKLLRRGRRRRLGDLHGLTFADIAGPNGAKTVRLLHGLLEAAGARERLPLTFEIPRRVQALKLDYVAMPRRLRGALTERGIRKLGDVRRLTPARLGVDFGEALWADLHELLERLPSLRIDDRPFASAIDLAIDRLAAPSRRIVTLRFGAKARPLTVRDVASRCRLRPREAARRIKGVVGELRDAGGTSLARALSELRQRARRREGRLSTEEVDGWLKITRSGPRYGRDFYLRMISLLEPGVKVAVVWGKKTRLYTRG